MIRCAQSRGECEGARRTLREGRERGGSVEVVGRRREGEGVVRGGARRVEAGEGGGRKVVVVVVVGVGRRVVPFEEGRGGGGIGEGVVGRGFCFEVRVGRGGGAIEGWVVR